MEDFGLHHAVNMVYSPTTTAVPVLRDIKVGWSTSGQYRNVKHVSVDRLPDMDYRGSLLRP